MTFHWPQKRTGPELAEVLRSGAHSQSLAFAFAFVKLGWDPAAWAAAGNEIEAAHRLHGATPTLALENHDIVRSVTRFGGVLGAPQARAALVALLGLPGPGVPVPGAGTRSARNRRPDRGPGGSAEGPRPRLPRRRPVRLPAGTVLLSAAPLAEQVTPASRLRWTLS